jgi:NAD(P)-dependent dehydrogenase (short-subunit alcohol dehydrogenase family)
MTSPRWTTADIPDLTGRTFLVTGANSGLGLATSRELARHGGHVVMAVRDLDRGAGALAALRATLPDAEIELRRLDLLDLDSVRTFADSVLDDGIQVDVLINNAGVMMPPRRLSPQGYESQFATNHLGHFALTELLLDRIKASPYGRVVTVSSLAHRGGRIRFDDLAGERFYTPTAFYSQSKLANALFGLELDRRLRAEGSQVRSVLAHPGYAATNLQTTGPRGLLRLGGRLGNLIFAQDAAAGAWSQLRAATDPDVQGGQFIGPGGWGELRGAPRVVRPTRTARDPELARRLWDVSEAAMCARADADTPKPAPTLPG